MQKPVFFLFLQITQNLNKIKKSHTPFLDNGKQKMFAKFQQKILNYRMVGARQSFEIFRQSNLFLKNNRALSIFLYDILYYLISVIKL